MNKGLSIKDLENLSGIKAHTIRMWEKRHNIFDPDRTETNIRLYSNEDLKKLLNIASVLEHGMKISKVSTLSTDELNSEIEQLQQENIEASKKISYLNPRLIALVVYGQNPNSGTVNMSGAISLASEIKKNNLEWKNFFSKLGIFLIG